MVVEEVEGLEEDCRYRRHASKKLKLTPPVIEDDGEDPLPMMMPKVSRHHLTDDRSPFKQDPNMSKGDEFWSTNGLGFPRGGAAGRGRNENGVLMPTASTAASATGYSSSYTSSSSSNATRTFRSTTPIMQNTSSSSSMIISYEDTETFPSSIASPTLRTIERYAPSSSTVRSLFQNNTREWGSPYSHGSGMMEED